VGLQERERERKEDGASLTATYDQRKTKGGRCDVTDCRTPEREAEKKRNSKKKRRREPKRKQEK